MAMIMRQAVKEWQEAHHALAKAVLSESDDLVPVWNRVTSARRRLMQVQTAPLSKLEYMRRYMQQRRAAKAQAQPLEAEGMPDVRSVT